jgi:hypothetical protein
VLGARVHPAQTGAVLKAPVLRKYVCDLNSMGNMP